MGDKISANQYAKLRNIVPRNPQRWARDGDVPGSLTVDRGQRSEYMATVEEWDEARAKIRRPGKQATYPAPGGEWPALLAGFQASLRASPRYMGRTAERYASDAGRFCGYLTEQGILSPAELEGRHIEAFAVEQTAHSVGAGTVYMYRAAMRKFLEFSGWKGEFPSHCWPEKPPAEEAGRALTDDEAARVLAAAAAMAESEPPAQAGRALALCVLLMECGLWLTEIGPERGKGGGAYLRLFDVHLAAGELQLQNTHYTRRRAVALSQDAVAALADYINRGRDAWVRRHTAVGKTKFKREEYHWWAGPEAPLFPAGSRRPLGTRTIRAVVTEIGSVAGLQRELAPVDLRATFERRTRGAGAEELATVQ